jgi:hypothetical protein
VSRKTAKKKRGRRAGAGPVLGYHERRDQDQLVVYHRDIDNFMAAHKSMLPSPNRQTLFFFPGGMACELWRSTGRFKDGVPNPPFRYDKMWLRLSSFLWRARKLGMEKDSAGLFRDKGNHIVIADGAVNFNGCTPHDGLIQWCRDNNVDLFVFNWDWRRRQEEVARFFVKKFWPLFKRRLKEEGIEQAAHNFSLLGHSFGGMVVNLILRDNDAAVAQKLRYAITAATPFYGYAGQTHRWFEGERLLNGDGKDEWLQIIRVINSMPGLYVLHFLDYQTYQRDRAALEGDEFPLVAYPSVDAETRADLDPWTQQTDPKGRLRYPEKTMGFHSAELTHALGVFQRMAAPISDQRFYNIRGVRVDEDGKPLSNTLSTVTCGWIREQFHPKDGCPIANAKARVPGDDTQPAWTARLASNDPKRCITVRDKDLSHMFLMSNPAALREVARILLGPHAAARVINVRPLPERASQDEFARFRTWMKEYGRGRSTQEPSDEEILGAMPADIRSDLARTAPSIIEEILKRPDAMH